ncbi:MULTISPECIES: co-chaperone YbbN [unclassified Colwellia]|uniref:thioredoxin family protein n=2 Tax=Colwellia TaxID=28228 RepID=UPI0015F590EC|nr:MULTISPECIES: thioredoxin family protein [unclassified Colwellia]MBA6358938.1 thioredoxin family protein [Colwellia sp. BRX8-6]MBA6351417.1 thioredoxin family protein [Colwellia sp. BRX9-1]MBA6354649.1 thioredoxin family protein [Colwellia sp. BRX8-3]MBA6366564.1 thioredoxin family protein [Colwellia sp. BRX8-5]MBA6374772.1 thioredoxin family protein [Colwellia sp. BRX8-2]
MMKQLTLDDSIDDLLSQHQYSLLYFTASWCGPCKTMSPIVEGASDLMKNRFNTIKIDVDSMASVAADYGIRSVPTLMLVNNSAIIDQRVGGLPQQQLIQWLEQRI